jgi:hypothetical protein
MGQNGKPFKKSVTEISFVESRKVSFWNGYSSSVKNGCRTPQLSPFPAFDAGQTHVIALATA